MQIKLKTNIRAGDIASLAADATEKADLRVSRYFPGKSYIGGINMEPGLYNIKINYFDSKDQILDTEIKNNILIKEGVLNLVESICLK